MNRRNLKTVMLTKGISLVKIASELGVSTNAVYLVISGKSSSKKIQSKISESFGLPFQAIQDAWINTTGPSEDAPEIKAMQERIKREYQLVS